MAGKKNWEVDQNTTFRFSVVYRDSNGDPIDLDGATAKMQVRDTAGGQKIAATLTSPNDGIIITPLQGRLDISLTPAQTNKLFYPKSSYDVILTDSNGNKIKLVEGFLTLSRSVTI